MESQLEIRKGLRLTRRKLLFVSAATTATALLAACGSSSSSSSTSSTSSSTASGAAAASPTAEGTQAPSSGLASTPVSAASPSAAATQASTGKSGGKKIYRIGTASAITELDPATTTTEVNNAPQEALFEPLARYTYDPPLGNQIVPQLAKSWDISSDAKTYTFHLQTGVKFHNGDSMTSDDVKWNLDRVKNPSTGSSARSDFVGATITAPDPATVVVAFDHPNPSFIQATIAYVNCRIISPKVYEKLGQKWITGPVGTGPFTWGSYLANTKLTLPRNENYWGTKPHIDEIEFHMDIDDQTASLAVSKAEIDAIYIADPNVAITDSKSTDANVKFMKAKYGTSPFNCWFNMRRKPLDDIRVRHALRYAIDSEAIAKELFGGLAQVIYSYLPPFMFGYSTDGVDTFEYDPNKAKQLLKEANITSDWHPEMISQAILPISRQTTEAIASYWKDVGVNIKNSSLEQGIIVKRSNARDYDMYATYVTRIDPSQLTARFWRSDGASNLSGYTLADNLIDQVTSEPNADKRAQLYRQLQQKLSSDSPASWSVAVSEDLLLNKRVSGSEGAGWLERFNWFDVDVPAE